MDGPAARSPRQGRPAARPVEGAAAHEARRRASSDLRSMVLANALVALVVLLIVAGAIWQDRKRRIADAFDQAGSLAAALAAHTDQTFGHYERALSTLAARLDPVALAAGVDPPGISAALRVRAELFPEVAAWVAVNRDGRLFASSGRAHILEDVSDREAFAAHRDDPGLGMRVSPPVQGRIGSVADRRVLHVSRRVNMPDGSFAGVIAAVVPTDAYREFLRALDLGDHGAAGLFRTDGTLIARYPHDETAVGRSYLGQPLFAAHLAERSAGRLRVAALSDGEVRLAAYRTVAGKALVVYVAFAEDDVLALWWLRSAVVGLLGLAVIVAILAFTIAIRRGLARLEDEQRRSALASAQLIDSLRAAEQRFYDFADVASDWLWETDENHRFTYLSARRAEVLGVPHGVGIGQSRSELTGIEEDALLAADLAARRPFRNHEVTTADGQGRTRQISISGRPIYDAQGRFVGYRGSATDLTAQREAEEQLRQSQKMEAIGQLTGGVAHDFNNLLTIIIGNAEDLGRELTDGPQRRLAQVIQEAGERGAALTGRLLAYSRRQTLQPQPVDADALLAGMESLLRRTLGEAVDLAWVRGAGLWTTFVDPHQLESALLNLAINARDAMPGGGRLTIETGNAVLDRDYAERNRDVRPGQYVAISVSDTGQGMTPEVAARAVEPFFTTKGVGKGTGLGLSMVYGFVKQSGGHLSIYSEPGLGTTLKLYLPRAGGAAKETAPAEPSPDGPGGGETILLVEDEPLVRDHVAGQLERLGYRVVAAADGRAALAALERDAAIELLFTDMVMPGGLDGRQLADEARRRRPGIRLLFTSGHTENVMIHQGRLDAGVHLLNKPYRSVDLARKIRAVLDEGRPLPG